MTASSEWVVLELTSKAEGEDPDIVLASIRHHIRDAEVFVPASVIKRGDDKVYQYLVDGYAFIRHKHPDTHYSRLEDTKYVQSALYTFTGKKEKKLATICSEDIEKLRSQIKVEVDQGIEVGDTVAITSGAYKHISAVVREEIPEQDSVMVQIKLRSTDRLVTLPRGFLKLEQKSPLVVYRDRFSSIATWTKMARTIIGWSEVGFDKVIDRFQGFSTWESWYSKYVSGYSFLHGYYTQLDLTDVRQRASELETLDRGTRLRRFVDAMKNPLSDLKTVAKNQQELTYLDDVQNRVWGVYSDLKRLDQRQDHPVNLVVDGTQLFIRCLEAPGLGSLTDSQGRSTGGVVGFLRSLASYKKRFSDSEIYVCWDGTSQRRKTMYEGYKANRTSRSGSLPFGWEWLKEFLPLLGVQQAFASDEEADDVIASLVRGPLKGHPNVIISSDRDLLQLVTDFTHQLCPAVGSGKEKLYDEALVEAEYGVSPSHVVHVRALSGDTSDNIPGVPNFGLKTATKVLKLYGTVDKVLASNLAGLGKAQVTNLRKSERQIRLNLELLRLYDVSFQQIRSNPDQIEAEARLKGLDIKSDPILAAFFPI